MARNTKKNTTALPRSFSKMTMSNATPHMTSMGASVRMSGNLNGPRRQVNTDSISRLADRYAAKNSTMTIFASSPGWNESGPMESQMRLP